ncbi:hypothetical protein EMIT0194P_200063 [Pseudomonas serbica]
MTEVFVKPLLSFGRLTKIKLENHVKIVVFLTTYWWNDCT